MTKIKIPVKCKTHNHSICALKNNWVEVRNQT
jgi:hypothetical protein